MAIDLTGVDLGPKMQACSDRERKFVWALATGLADTATEAARQAGYSDPGKASAAIRVTAHALMHRERVIEAIEEVTRREFRSLIAPALAATRAMLTNRDHPDHAKTVQSMLSRLGFGERTGVDVKVSGEVRLNHTDQALADLRTLLELGVAREKLVEIFGYSGLTRYEKMLGEQPKQIEGRAEHVE